MHELGYTAAAAWRRIKAMRLCSATNGARELLQDGKLNLSNAAQLQNLFERSDRGHGRLQASQGIGGSPGGAPRNDGAPGEPAPADPTRDGGRDPAPGAGSVLDDAAREELVQRAAGKSTREVQQMVAEVDPELAQRSDRLRALGNGRWELKAAIDAECRHGLEKLQMLLSHVDPHLTLGGLVERLVRDGLDRYDPARPPRARGSGARGSVNVERSVDIPARRATNVGKRSLPQAKGGAIERGSEVGRDDASSAAVCEGVPRPSAPKRVTQGEGVPTEVAERHCAAGGSAPGRDREAEHACGQPIVMRGSGGRVASAAKPACVRRRAWRGGAGGAFAGTGAAPRGVELLRWVAVLPVPPHPCCCAAGGVAARSGSLQLCRPGQRAALRLPLSAGDRPHRAVRARRRCRAGEFEITLPCAPQVAARSAPSPPRELAD